jgi:ABC-2 type transport system ATP-binding protein
LTKSFGSRPVLRGITLQIPAGKITGLLGSNGSGKTTLLRTMTGLSRPDQGEARFGGVLYRDLTQPATVVGCMFDPMARHPGRSVVETVRLQAFYSGVSAARAAAMVDLVGLGPVRKRRFRQLSLGMKQRVALAVTLLGEPQFLLMDEPMNGLDVETIMWLRQAVEAFAHQRGGTVLISSHLLQELQSFADQIVVMNQGAVVFQGPPSQVRQATGSLARTSQPARLSTVLATAHIQHRWRPAEGRFEVHAPADVVGRIAYERGVLVEELAPDAQHVLEAFYFPVNQGESRVGGTPSV